MLQKEEKKVILYPRKLINPEVFIHWWRCLLLSEIFSDVFSFRRYVIKLIKFWS